MTTCAIRYRLDGPGPAAFLIECDGQLRIYTRGVVGGVMAASRLLSVLAERGCRWMPAQGSVDLELETAATVEEVAGARLAPPPILPDAGSDGHGAHG